MKTGTDIVIERVIARAERNGLNPRVWRLR